MLYNENLRYLDGSWRRQTNENIYHPGSRARKWRVLFVLIVFTMTALILTVGVTALLSIGQV